MNQNFYNSNSSGFDQFQLPQYPVIHHPPQETSLEMLQAKKDLMNTIQKILRQFNRISVRETPKILLLAWEKFGEIQHTQTNDIQELLNELLKDLQIISEELTDYILPNWNRPAIFYVDDDDYNFNEVSTIPLNEISQTPSSDTVTPILPTKETKNSLSMGDEPLSTIPETELDEVIKSSVENLVLIPSEFEDISNDGCDLSHCDNSSPNKIDFSSEVLFNFLPEEFAGELTLLNLIPPEVDEEEGEIDISQIEEEVLREKLLKVNLLIAKIKAFNLTPSIPSVLEDPSSSPIPVVDSDFLIEEVDTFLVLEDLIPPGIESDFDSEGDIIFLNDLLNDYPIPEYERSTFDIEPDTPVIINSDELNEDECFDPGGGEIYVSQNIEDDDSFTFVIRTFLPFLTYPVDSTLLLSTGSEDTIFDPGIYT
ncbi:hypothetical protein Tco_0737613 [Tanacetum coccineum]